MPKKFLKLSDVSHIETQDDWDNSNFVESDLSKEAKDYLVGKQILL